MKTPEMEMKRRYQALRAAMAEKDIEYFVAGSSAQLDHRGMLRYFTDYYISCFEEFLVIPAVGPVVFFSHDGCQASYMEEMGWCDQIRRIPGNEYNRAPGKCVGEYLKEKGAKRVGVAGLAGVSAHFADSLREAADGITFVDFDREVWAIRSVKSPYEMELSRAAIRLNEENYRYYLGLIKEGVKEMDAVDAAGAYGWTLDAEDQYWLTDTQPHPVWRDLPLARRKNHIWQKEDMTCIVLEHSARGGHFSELSRHISLGEPKEDMVKAYAALKEAQDAAFAVMKPGNTIGQMAKEAERALAETEFGRYLKNQKEPSAMGHSQGLDIWEYPRIISNEDTVMRPGLRLNLHPSAQMADGAMISFCDLYAITENGAEKLSALPDEIKVL